jgi:hypothetical protein
MFKTLTDTSKAAIFTALVLILAVAAALAINTLGLASSEFVWGAVWSITPVLATLIMLLVVTRDGYSRSGWQSLGLGRLGSGCGRSPFSGRWRSSWPQRPPSGQLPWHR